MIEDVGRIRSRRNSALAEDIEGFSLEENPAIKPLDSDNRRYSSYLTPEDAWRSERRPPLRHSRSMEVLTEFSQPEKDKVGLVYQSRQNNDLEEQIQSANPWQTDEKVGGIAYTLKVSVLSLARTCNSPPDHCCWRRWGRQDLSDPPADQEAVQ